MYLSYIWQWKISICSVFRPWYLQLRILVWRKNATNVYMKTTGRLLGRPWKCIRHSFDDILTYSTPLWRYFDAANTFLKAFLTFSPVFLWFFGKSAPCVCRKHNSRYRHKAFYIKTRPFDLTSMYRSLPRSEPLGQDVQLWAPPSNRDLDSCRSLCGEKTQQKCVWKLQVAS